MTTEQKPQHQNPSQLYLQKTKIMRHVTVVTSTRHGPHVDAKPACSHYHMTKNLDQQAVYLQAEVKNAADVGSLMSLVGPRIKTTLKYITAK